MEAERILKKSEKILNEIKKGNDIRVKFKEFAHDYMTESSGWFEELWIYHDDKFVCYYPASTYQKDFSTIHSEEDFILTMKFNISSEDEIIIESPTLRLAEEKLKTMSEKELLNFIKS